MCVHWVFGSVLVSEMNGGRREMMCRPEVHKLRVQKSCVSMGIVHLWITGSVEDRLLYFSCRLYIRLATTCQTKVQQQQVQLGQSLKMDRQQQQQNS